MYIVFIFILGLYDALPHQDLIQLLYKYLPQTCYNKLKKYVTCDYKNLKSHIHWPYFKSQLHDLNLQSCASELLTKLCSISTDEKCVKIFHIDNNEKSLHITEPTPTNILEIVYKFLVSIYQRNVLASLIKYILLKDLLIMFDTFTFNKKGIIEKIKIRLNAIIFECNITAFNGSNYDYYLLCNSLIIIQERLGQKIQLFKKGASLSTIYLRYFNNLNYIAFGSTRKNKTLKQSKISSNWPSYLYFKDIRNLVAANMSLDKIGKLLNLPVSKLCFPYNQAISIRQLKTLDSLKPNNELFWTDTFSNKYIPIEQRLEAQKIFEQKKFHNLYEYNAYYLTLDCVLLHSIVLTLFRNYLLDDINIFLRRNFSQSSLSYEQFFIVEPSKQIICTLAPMTINNTFMNYFIRTAVTGGVCTSFVHGHINKNTIINEHLKYLDQPNLNANVWPNLQKCDSWKSMFKNTPAGIATIDIRSLYPSAALKNIPVGMPYFYSRFVSDDFEHVQNTNLFTYNIHSFCTTVQREGNYNSDFFKLLNRPIFLRYEYNVLALYLQSLPKNIKILRFQSNFTAFGQLYIDNLPVDGFLSYQNLSDNKIFIKIIQYDSVYCHGHKQECIVPNNNEEKLLADKTKHVKSRIIDFFNQYISHFQLTHVNFEYVSISECDFINHCIPQIKSIVSYNSSYTYNLFLEKIYNNSLNGFIVVKNLELKKQSQNPFFGFIIQKTDYNYENLSPYTQEQLNWFIKTPRVVGLHKSNKFMTISTEYFRWLYTTFGFEQTPDIYHALLFQTEQYLRTSIENKLKQRKSLKELIKTEINIDKRLTMEIKSELIKLMLNSCYGFTLCNVDSEKFKRLYVVRNIPRNKNKCNVIIKITDHVYLIEAKKNIEYPHQTLLGHIGCSILYHSKIILLKRLYYLLKYLNPSKAQLLYMDTDSAHFLVQHKEFKDNVDTHLQLSFIHLFNKHFETGNKVSGIWVTEGFFDTGEYIGEKCYKLQNVNDKSYLVHMKGLNSYFQHQYVQNNIDTNKNPCITFNNFFKSPDFLLFKVHMSKDLFTNYVPIKRYFVCATGSLPLQL